MIRIEGESLQPLQPEEDIESYEASVDDGGQAASARAAQHRLWRRPARQRGGEAEGEPKSGS
jgi:hypothetical protein